MAISDTTLKIIKWSVIGVVVLGVLIGAFILIPKGITDVVIKPIISVGKIINPGSSKEEDLDQALDVVNGKKKDSPKKK